MSVDSVHAEFVQIVQCYLQGNNAAGCYIDLPQASVPIGIGDGILYGPGGFQLLRHWKDQILMGLDFLFDYPDSLMNEVRAFLIGALDELKVDVIPVSYNALSRIPRLASASKFGLVDRIGQECVFSVSDISSSLRYFISGYDHNETPPLYFLARLPHSVKTYAEAIESLKPQSVKLAEKKGLKVLRQGDMFAIPTEYTTKKLERKGAKIAECHGLTSQSSLYGTGHYAERTAQLPDGTMFGGDYIMHSPPGRRPDHHPLPLPDDKWYLIVKNTVPIQEGR